MLSRDYIECSITKVLEIENSAFVSGVIFMTLWPCQSVIGLARWNNATDTVHSAFSFI